MARFVPNGAAGSGVSRWIPSGTGFFSLMVFGAITGRINGRGPDALGAVLEAGAASPDMVAVDTPLWIFADWFIIVGIVAGFTVSGIVIRTVPFEESTVVVEVPLIKWLGMDGDSSLLVPSVPGTDAGNAGVAVNGVKSFLRRSSFGGSPFSMLELSAIVSLPQLRDRR